METTVDKQKRSLVKRFHTLLGKCGIGNEEKALMLAQYGVESSRDLNLHELLEICTALDRLANPQLAEADKWRKRLIAAIGGWLKAMSKENNLEMIKGIACRAAGVVSFNRIPTERLRSLYYAFQKKQKDLAFTEKLTAEEIGLLTASN